MFALCSITRPALRHHILGCRTLGDKPFPEFEEDLDWRVIEPSLIAEILALPSRLTQATRSVSICAQVGCDPIEECVNQTALCGTAAIDVAIRLRKSHGLPPMTMLFLGYTGIDIMRARANSASIQNGDRDARGILEHPL